MALFVTIMGALLAFGGATSLLFGFDIVMTERGNAMTIAGTIALSGGIVVIALGFALTRLTQILNTLESNRARSRPGHMASQRPVVPSPHALIDETPEPAATKPAISPAVAVGAGLTAAASLAGGIVISQGASAEEPSTTTALISADETLSNSEQSAERGSEPPATDDLTAPVSLPDLEAELSKALAEADHSIPLPVSLPETFKDNLATLLNKTKDKRRKASAALLTDVIPDPPAVGTTAPEEVDPVPVSVTDETAIPLQPTLPDEPLDDDLSLNAADADFTKTMRDVPEDVEEIYSAKNTVDGQPEIALAQLPKPDVIGSYKVGGNAYTMFSDGSVEAMTEQGIERFASMDDLRKHLSRT